MIVAWMGRVGKFLQQVDSFFWDAEALQSQLIFLNKKKLGSFCNRSALFLGRGGGTSKPTGNLSPTKQTQTHTQMTNITSKKRQTFKNDERCCKGET